jgi:hypothetical protein
MEVPCDAAAVPETAGVAAVPAEPEVVDVQPAAISRQTTRMARMPILRKDFILHICAKFPDIPNDLV